MALELSHQLRRIDLAKTKVIFNIARPGDLAPDVLADNEGLEQFSDGVDRCAQTCRTGAENDRIIEWRFRHYFLAYSPDFNAFSTASRSKPMIT